MLLIHCNNNNSNNNNSNNNNSNNNNSNNNNSNNCYNKSNNSKQIATFTYTISSANSYTVKPFNLAALKVGDLACKIILAPYILAN